MKNKMFTFLLAVMASVGTMFAETYSGSCGELTWSLNTADSVLTISGTGSMEAYASSKTTPWYSNRESIKSIVIEDGVVSIGKYAFSECNSLTAITIPNSVIFIGSSAFSGCSSLTAVTFPNSVVLIEGAAFYGCSSLNAVNISDLAAWCKINFSASTSNPLYYAKNLYLNGTLVKDLVIPNGITKINDYAFYNCSSLTSVTIPNSVTSIGKNAFYGNKSLASITIPNSIDTIGSVAFSGCTNLTAVNIYDLAAWCSIKFSASTSNPLYYAKNLYLNGTLVKDLVIPNGVTKINDYIFYNCGSLTSVTIPNSVTSIGTYSFYGCNVLASITIPNGVTSIGEYAFNGCSVLASITIPNGVTSIGEYAFSGCTNLTAVYISDLTAWCHISFGFSSNPLNYAKNLYLNGTLVEKLVIPDGITKINDYAFYGCSSITSVFIPNGVTSIGKYAFNGCKGLTSVNIPNSVTTIESSAFSTCSGLTAVYISDLTAWCNISFGSTASNNPLFYAKNLYLNGILVEKLVIPDGITKINDYAFYGCSSITSVTIPNSVTSIGNSAFHKCSGLASITIPNSVTSIGSSAFYNCTGLTSITNLATTPQAVTSYVFGNLASNTAVDYSACTLYVPAESVEAYQTAEVWKEFTNILPIGESPDSCVIASGACGAEGDNLTWTLSCDSVLTISGTGAMADYEYVDGGFSSAPWNDYRETISSLEFQLGVTSIGEYAFYQCRHLTTVTLPSSVISIGRNAFDGCANLISATIPNSVTTIGWYAFSACTNLSSVTIPESVTELGIWPFQHCSGLTSIDVASTNPKYSSTDGVLFYKTESSLLKYPAGKPSASYIIPDNTTSISDYAFEGSTHLTSVTIPNSVTDIRSYAFRNCENLASLTIPNSVTRIGGYAFLYCTGLTSVICKAITPPTIASTAFYGVDISIPLYVPAQSVAAYQAADVWKEFGNIVAIGDSVEADYITVAQALEIGAGLEAGAYTDKQYTIRGYVSYISSSFSGQYLNQNFYIADDSFSTASSNAQGGFYVYRGKPTTGTAIREGALVEITASIYNFRGTTIENYEQNTPVTVLQEGPECRVLSGTCGENLTWAFNYCDSVLTISGTGAMADYELNGAPWYSNRASIKFVIIEDGVTSIGDYAFSKCSGLTSIDIPNSVTSIGDYAFSKCTGLTSVTIPNSVTNIGESAFWACSGLPSIEIPNSVTNIGDHAFINCDGLTSINVSNGNANYCSVEGVLFNKDNTVLVQYPGGKKGNYTIPNGVTSIGGSAFYNCSGLTSVTIPNSVTSIGYAAFYDCTALTSVTIPNSVTSIGDFAFTYCDSLTSVTNYSITPQAINANVFNNVNKSTCALYVPAQSLAAYQTADVWKEFGNILPIEESGEVEVLSIAEAIQTGMALDSMATSAETYTIEGYVINAGTFNSGAKYQNWYMADDAEATSSDFQAYRCYPIDGTDTVEVHNGAKVRMTGKLQKYYNRSTGKYIVEMTYTPAFILSKPQIDTITVAEALALGAELEDNASTSKQYAIRGYVSSVSQYYEQLGDQDFYIADDPNSTANTNAAGGFYVYRGIPSTGSAVNKGDLVELTCAIRKYVPASGTNIKIENSEFPVAVTVLQTASDTCIVASGTCGAQGDNLTWTLTCDSVLTISGTGAMADYGESTNKAPWVSLRFAIHSVIIENGVSRIGNFAFHYKYYFTSVTIPSSVTQIGIGAFYGCNFISLVLPNSVTTIEESAFRYCRALTSVSIPSSVQTIGSDAFEFCDNLETVYIPSSVISIGNSAFAGNKKMRSINVDEANPNYSSIDGVLFNKNQTVLVQYPLGKEGAQYTIPNTVTTLESMSFSYFSKTLSYNGELTSIVIPNSVTMIYGSAFWASTAITSITNYAMVPQVITANDLDKSTCTLYVPAQSIEAYQAADVWKEFGTILPIEDTPEPCILASGTCGAQGDNLTWTLSCDSVLTISGTGAMEDYEWNKAPWFSNAANIVSVEISEGITSVGQLAFSDCSSLTSVTIPNSITSIGDYAFVGCSGLTCINVGSDNSNYCSVDGVLFNKDKTTLIQYPGGKQGTYTIPNSVTSIGDWAFAACSGLTLIEIPNSVISIGSYAFSWCTLTFVTIPNSVTSIGGGAFYDCTSLISVTIPNSVTSIGYMAFYNCSGLTSITCVATIPPTCGDYAFDNVPKTIPVYVPAESVEAYQTADVWKEFFNILPIEGTEEPVETVEGNYTIYYEDKDSQNLTNEVVTLHVPVAPVIEGFTFVEWRVAEGSLSLGITIQAVYKASEPTSAPEIYTNPANSAQKLIRNGNVYILTEDKVYTITGQKIQSY